VRLDLFDRPAVRPVVECGRDGLAELHGITHRGAPETVVVRWGRAHRVR
jgi:hypothetical protein